MLREGLCEEGTFGMGTGEDLVGVRQWRVSGCQPGTSAAEPKGGGNDSAWKPGLSAAQAVFLWSMSSRMDRVHQEA